MFPWSLRSQSDTPQGGFAGSHSNTIVADNDNEWIVCRFYHLHAEARFTLIGLSIFHPRLHVRCGFDKDRSMEDRSRTMVGDLFRR